jgi:hypothetical protein
VGRGEGNLRDLVKCVSVRVMGGQRCLLCVGVLMCSSTVSTF